MFEKECDDCKIKLEKVRLHEVRITVMEEKMGVLHKDFEKLEDTTKKVIEVLEAIRSDVSTFKTSFKVVSYITSVFFALATVVISIYALK